MKKIIAIAFTIGLAGCNQAVLPDMTTTGSVFGASTSAVFGGHKSAAYEHTIAEKRPVQSAFLKLPNGAGDVVDLTERRHKNGVEQLIVYAGDFETRGQNAARVRLKVNKFGMRKPKGGLKILPPSEAILAREMRKVLPGVSMNVSNEFHTNAYGPFGYALGRASGNINCIYGWQHMRGNGKVVSELPLFNKASDKPELSLRLRVCKYNTPARKLVDLMRNLRIDADPSRAMSPERVSWNAGPGGSTSMAMPAYEQGGYVSDEIIAAEPAPQEKPVERPVAVKAKKKPRVVNRPTVVNAAPRQVKPVANHAAVPLPPSNTLAQPLNRKPVQPLPKPNELARVVTPVVGYTSPVAKQPTVKPKNGFSAVPLP